MSIYSIFILDIKRIFKNKMFYTSILLSILFGSALVYTIKVDQGPFTINAVSSFYGTVATLSVVLLGIKLFIDDLSNQTIVLFFSSRKNRISYLIGKLLSATSIGFIFGVICSIFMIMASFVLDWEIDLLTYFIRPICLYTLFSMFYISFFFLISIFIRKPTTLVTLAILFILAIPSILENIIYINKLPDNLSLFIGKIPFYFLTPRVKLLQLSGVEVTLTFITASIMIMASYYFVTTEDY